METHMSIETNPATINQAIDSAISENKRRLFIQHLMESTPMKLVATGFLLTSLFAATFLVAYQTTKSEKVKASYNEVPEAEIIIPAEITKVPKESLSQFCGGIAGLTCPDGYTCKLDGDYPDAGGSCAPEEPKPIDSETPVAP
jgi:hypothetical protein